MSKKKCNRTEGIVQTPHEKFMLEVYREIDKAIAEELERLRIKAIVPSCMKGCYFCCRQEVPVVIPEAHALGQYIKRYFSDHQKNELRKRMFDWFQWGKNELSKHGNTPEDEMEAFYSYGPYCPLLVDGKCATYPVRPVVCRIHYVSSSPDSCRSYTDAQSAQEEPTGLVAISYAVQPFAMLIRESIEGTGVNYDDVTLLLPQWLMMELGWEGLLSAGD